MPTQSRRPRHPDHPEFEDLDGLSSEDLEAAVFGPDPSAPKRTAPTRTVGRDRSASTRTPDASARADRRAARRAAVPTKFCFACGDEVDARAEICPHCGVRQPDVPARTGRPDKDRVVAILLAFFLGGIGGHKFYLGKPVQGLVFLLFFWTLIPSIIGFVDFVRYLIMDDEQFQEKYG